MSWVVKKVTDAKTPAWVVVLLFALLVIGAGLSGTLLVLRRRKYAKLVHERNVLLEEKKAAVAQAELAGNEKERKSLEAKKKALEKRAAKIDEKRKGLDAKHELVKKALEGVTDWSDLRID